MTLYLHLSECTYEDLSSAYILVEPILAELAARNPDRRLVKEVLAPFLESSSTCHGSMQDLSAGISFHSVLANLAGNDVLRLAFSAVGLVFTDHICSAAPRLTFLADEDVDDHRAIAEAVVFGKPELARNLMEKHVRRTVARFEAAWPLRVGEQIRWL